jgi:7,8-dihydroneopterin aldolase/epimerase/oxygenase
VLSCIVGIRPAERHRRQEIALSIELDLDLGRAGRSGRIGHTVDYSVVADEVSFLLGFREYRLVEMATEEIAAMILGLHGSVERAQVTLEKPEALRGRAEHASVCISRSRSELAPTPLPFGEKRLLLDTAEAKLELFVVDPGQRVDVEARPARRTLAWLAAGHLEAGSPVTPHDPRELERLFGATNPGPERATLFVCTLQN